TERGFPRPVAHLPNFIDLVDQDWRNPGPRPQAEPYFLFVGRLELIKGLQTLIGIWDRVGPYDLLVAGTGGVMSRNCAPWRPAILGSNSLSLCRRRSWGR